MARTVVSKEEVIKAAQELEAQPGGVANSSTVFEALGRRGSYSTILKHLREWQAAKPTLAPAAPMPPQVQDSMAAMLRDLWHLARSFADGEAQTVKDSAEQKARAADLQRLDVEAALTRVEKDYEALEEAHAKLDERAKLLDQELAASKALLASAEGRLGDETRRAAALANEVGHWSA